jgi:hypothetical protein
MSKPTSLLLLPVVLLVAVACTTSGGASSAGPSASPSNAPSGASSGGPSGAPSSSPSSTPAAGIEHATGAGDVVLRYENGGGFVAPGFAATETPIFTLYGDGVVVFRNPALEGPPAQGSVFPQNPMRTARLSEEQIQDLLTFALGEGGLGIARASYENGMVADAPTATFSVNAGGLKKVVTVYALGMDVDPANSADGPARAAFQRLADRLADFDQGGTIATDVYQPAAYRGILMDGQAAPDAIAWPWTDLKPTDFAFPADANAFRLATHVLSPAQVEQTGLKDVQGGFQGLTVTAPDGSKPYSLSVRPLLPDETQ